MGREGEAPGQGVPTNQERPDREEYIEAPSSIPFFASIQVLCRNFTTAFILFLTFQMSSNGMWIVVVLAAQNHYESGLKLQAAQMALNLSIVTFPWSLKLIFGLVSDNISIRGKYR